jgi:hypothetical protein
MPRALLLVLLLLTSIYPNLFGQKAGQKVEAKVEKRLMNAQRVETAPKIDGDLSDPVWIGAEVATDFVQNRPNPGRMASQKTEVKILYDDEAIYMGAMMYDTAPDSILHQLSDRDQLGNTDYFGVWISCFQDGINAFEFIVSPDGVQFDAQVSTFGEDQNWNAVWQCNTSITEEGWVAEFKIPYSAIRFAEKEEQVWDINFNRVIRRHREQSFWQHVDPEVAGFVNQSGVIKGIKDIKPPLRLFFYPYASAYVQVDSDGEGTYTSGSSYNGGMDVKYGISDAFTLDATLVPDFGQVQSDNLVLNLGPFEVQFQENRQFFTEGTELFSKGNLFYSRRVGGRPMLLENVVNSLDSTEELGAYNSATQLINATKISGRNKRGLGIGVFNAVTQAEYATVRNSLTNEERRELISPLTNYNIVVLDQNLKNNSYITLINTNVARAGSTYDANVTGTTFNIRDKSNLIEVSGGATYNKKFNFGDPETDDGFAYDISVNKIKGNLNGGVGHSVESRYFDKNDLGFLFNPNELSTYVWGSYNIYEPFGRFNGFWCNVNLWHGMLYEPRAFKEMSLNFNAGINTKKFNTFGIEAYGTPVNEKDYFGPRVDGYHFEEPKKGNFSVWYSSDYRKRVAADISVGYTSTEISNWNSGHLRLAPRFRVNHQFMINYVYSLQYSNNNRGWATHDDNEDQIIYAARDIITHTNVLNLDYIFTNRMGVSFRLRHYWSYVNNHEFFQLAEDGALYATDFQGFEDDGSSPYNQSFNAFNIDMVYKWVFSPGSEIRVVWKQNITDFTEDVPVSFQDNFERTIGLPQSNSISLKVLYFIDYLSLTRKGSRSIEN